MARVLALFDIDGTILLSGPVVHEAFLGTVADICGASPEAMEFPFAGMTDRAIFQQLCEIVGVEDPDGAKFEQFRQEYPRRLREIYPAATTPHLLPGVESLVRKMDEHPDIDLALATGNLEAAAHIKLSRFGLDHRFPTGGFGDHHSDRAEMVRSAISGAVDHSGRHALRSCWVIGDTPKDVAAARATGCRVLAVATGFSSTDDLQGADVVVETLADSRVILDAILKS